MKKSIIFVLAFCLAFGLAGSSFAASDPASVQDAYAAASRGAELVFAYTQGDTYRIYCQDTFVTDIKFQPGEEIMYAGAGDTARWMIDKAAVGAGSTKTWHLYLKPLKQGITTNMIINTNRRTYQLEIVAGNVYNPMVCWNYPLDDELAVMRQMVQNRDDEAQRLLTVDPENLHFNYRISHKEYAWSPEQVFDDGKKTYIRMKKDMPYTDAPSLFVLDNKGRAVLVNYRLARNYYVLDRTFEKAEFALGDKKVIIERR